MHANNSTSSKEKSFFKESIDPHSRPDRFRETHVQYSTFSSTYITHHTDEIRDQRVGQFQTTPDYFWVVTAGATQMEINGKR